MTKKKVIIISILCVCLILLLVVNFVISKNEESDDDETKGTPTNVAVGEGTYLNKITLYPEISKSSLVSVDITNEDGTVVHLTHKEGSEKLYLKFAKAEFEVQSGVYSYLISNITKAITLETDSSLPIRDIDDEKMADFGLTEESCTSKYVIKYLDGEEEKEITVLIGYEVYSTQSARYVCVEGRNTAYTMLNTETFIDLTMEKCVDPLIYNKYTSTTVATSIKNFSITYGTTPVIHLKNTTDALTASYGEAEYSLTYPVETLADSEYVLNVLTTLFTTFSGDEVVSLNPDSETLKKYGLNDPNNVYYIGADHMSGENSIFVVSALMDDGYYYVRSPMYQEYDVDVIIRVSQSTLSFLSQKDETMIKWAATNTPVSGFYKYIHADESANQSGVKLITVKTPDFEETFYLTCTVQIIDGEEYNYLTVVGTSGQTFEDDYSVLNDKDY